MVSVGLVPTGTDVCITKKSICRLNREVKWTVKTVLLSALEAVMSCDFRISDVRHLDSIEREKIALPGHSLQVLSGQTALFLLGISRVCLRIPGYICVCVWPGTPVHMSICL